MGKPLDQYQSTCRHGTAYTTITSRCSDIETETTYFVPLGQIFEYWRLRVTNRSSAARTLDVFAFCEMATNWHMPTDLTNLQYAQFICNATVEDGMLGMAMHPYVPVDPEQLQGSERSWMTLCGA